MEGGKWVVREMVARLLATAALWVRIQRSLKNTKWAIEAKEWATHSSPPKCIQFFFIYFSENLRYYVGPKCLDMLHCMAETIY
jgi:hypothetical protein